MLFKYNALILTVIMNNIHLPLTMKISYIMFGLKQLPPTVYIETAMDKLAKELLR